MNVNDKIVISIFEMLKIKEKNITKTKYIYPLVKYIIKY